MAELSLDIIIVVIYMVFLRLALSDGPQKE